MNILDRMHKQTRGLIRGRARAALAKSEEGGALVEVALTVPVLLGVMTGIITFAIAYSNQLTLTQAVGSAGQYLAQIRTSTTNPCADTFTALKNAAPGLNSAKISHDGDHERHHNARNKLLWQANTPCAGLAGVGLCDLSVHACRSTGSSSQGAVNWQRR